MTGIKTKKLNQFHRTKVIKQSNDLPLSHSSDIDISDIFVWVMSLCDAKKSTTSRFSFLIGTISKRHQNGVPEKINMGNKKEQDEKKISRNTNPMARRIK